MISIIIREIQKHLALFGKYPKEIYVSRIIRLKISKELEKYCTYETKSKKFEIMGVPIKIVETYGCVGNGILMMDANGGKHFFNSITKQKEENL